MNNCWLLRRTTVRGGSFQEKETTFSSLKVGVRRDEDLLMYQQYRSDPVSVAEVEAMCGSPLVVKATFITTRYKFSLYFYFDVIQLGSRYYVVGTLKRDINNPEHKVATQSLDNEINNWWSANSKIVEFICHSRNENKQLWPLAPHEATYISPEGLQSLYKKHDPLLPLCSDYQKSLATLIDVLPDTHEKEAKDILLEMIQAVYKEKGCWWEEFEFVMNQVECAYAMDPRSKRNQRKQETSSWGEK